VANEHPAEAGHDAAIDEDGDACLPGALVPGRIEQDRLGDLVVVVHVDVVDARSDRGIEDRQAGAVIRADGVDDEAGAIERAAQRFGIGDVDRAVRDPGLGANCRSPIHVEVEHAQLVA